MRKELRRRQPALFALVATMPAFCLEMLDENVTWLAIGAYLTAALMLAAVLWHAARATAETASIDLLIDFSARTDADAR